MEKQAAKNATPTDNKIRRAAIVTVTCDVLLIVALVICLLTYISRNNAGSYAQNVDSISNIAAASSQLIQAALDNTNGEITGAYNYCDGKSVQEILDYLSLVNGPESEYQLLRRDDDASTTLYHVYAGYSTRKDANGAYQELLYADTALSQSLYKHAAAENGAVSFSQSFTNKTDALRYFAVFCGINVDVNGESQRYFLVKPQKESRLLDQAQTFTQYRDVSVAICYPDGKYLARDNGFRAENFYDYLYQYNGLSLDEKNAIRTAVQNDEDGAGILSYRDYQKRACVFAYATCGDAGNWRVIVCVPTSEFVSEKLLSFFPLTIILFLVVLLVFNISRLLVIVKELRLSVKRETVASAAKSSFLSRMSHEIRTPLNAVIGYNTIAQNEMTDARDDAGRKQAEMKVKDCLAKSEIASKHLLTIINDVLDMSAIEGGKIVIAHDRFDFKGLVTSLTTVFDSQAKTKNVAFAVRFDTPTAEWFVGDSMRVNQILTNLLSNAIKFTPGGGSVALTIRQSDATADAAQLQFTVTDTGIGMTQEYLRHIWTPFEQADSSISRRFGGSGLGLSITKSLVDLMGGSITVTSTLGVGTTFRVALTFEKTAQPAAAPEKNEAVDFGGARVILAEDNAMNMEIAKAILQSAGVEVACAWNGKEAVELFEASPAGTYMAILMDVHMPVMDGHEATRTIRACAHPEAATIPIIAMTADAFAENVAEAYAAGMNAHVPKPIDIPTLFSTLQRYR